MNSRETKILIKSVEILKKKLKPAKVILFGSRAKSAKSSHADFDFAVDCKKPGISMQREINEEIEGISGLYKVDIVYMPSVDKEFKDIIIKTGKVVYERRA